MQAERESLLTAARRLCRGHDDPHDLVQDTLERALKSHHKLPPDANERAWLLTIMTNLFIDRTRRRRARPGHEPIDEERLAATAPDEAPDPLWDRVTREQLHAAIAELSDKLQPVYRLHALDGLDYASIAERLGIPKATVGTRLMLARQRLRELLSAQVGGTR